MTSIHEYLYHGPVVGSSVAHVLWMGGVGSDQSHESSGFFREAAPRGAL
jgi:hypothetical protein